MMSILDVNFKPERRSLEMNLQGKEMCPKRTVKVL